MKKDGTVGFCGSAKLKQTQSRPKFSQSMVINSPPFVAPREYPKGLGESIGATLARQRNLESPITLFEAEKRFKSIPFRAIFI